MEGSNSRRITNASASYPQLRVDASINLLVIGGVATGLLPLAETTGVVSASANRMRSVPGAVATGS